MDVLALTLVCLLNFVISIWNANVCGKAWAHQTNGWDKLLYNCGFIMAGCGFTSVFAIVAALVMVNFNMLPEHAIEAYMNMIYLTIIFPVLGTGLVITVDSWRRSINEGSWVDHAITFYNTGAQISNLIHAASNVPSAFESVGQFIGGAFDGDGDTDSDAVIGILVIAAVVFSAGLGFLTAFIIANKSKAVEIGAGRKIITSRVASGIESKSNYSRRTSY